MIGLCEIAIRAQSEQDFQVGRCGGHRLCGGDSSLTAGKRDSCTMFIGFR